MATSIGGGPETLVVAALVGGECSDKEQGCCCGSDEKPPIGLRAHPHPKQTGSPCGR